MKKFKINKNKQGAALMTVIVVMALVLILLVSTLSVSIIASNQTYSTFEEQQAYYTARSTLEGFGATLNNDTAFDAYLVHMAQNASIGDEVTTPTAVSVPGYGDVKVTVKKVAADTVKVTASVDMLGSKNSTSMVLQIPPPQSVITFNNATVSFGDDSKYNSNYVSKGGMAAKGYFETNNDMIINGNVYVADTFKLQNSTIVNGGSGEDSLKIESTERIWLDGFYQVIPSDGMVDSYMTAVELYSQDANGNIGTLTKPVNIYAKAIHINNGSGKFYGDIFISQPEAGYTPTFNVNNISGGEYFGDIYVDGDLNLGGPSVKIHGNVYATGNITYNPYYAPTFLSGSSINPYTGVDVPYKKPTTEDVYFKDVIDTTTPSGYKTPESQFNFVASSTGLTYDLEDMSAVVGGVYTITGSGKLTGKFQHGVQYVIEVGDTPVYIEWPNQKAELDSNHKDIIINRTDPTSNTGVYFYLPSDMTIGGGKKVITNVTAGMIANGDIFYTGNSGDASKQITDLQNVNWLVKDGAKIQITGSGAVEGKFYGPGAEFNLNGTSAVKARVSKDGVNVEDFFTSVIGSIIGHNVKLNNTTGVLFSKGSGNTPPPPPNPMGSFEVINYQRS